ncbi:hypothetical protein VTL71DRAFT_4733 [Oculimacula yallundae]|uniref:Uncharacterized protein n=1 Tax=Oculimacula yallundae TaxID=86028 RepID=A0ABR4C2W5_9HELO
MRFQLIAAFIGSVIALPFPEPKVASYSLNTKRADASADTALGDYYERKNLEVNLDKRAEAVEDVALGDYYERKNLEVVLDKRGETVEDVALGDYYERKNLEVNLDKRAESTTEIALGKDVALGDYYERKKENFEEVVADKRSESTSDTALGNYYEREAEASGSTVGGYFPVYQASTHAKRGVAAADTAVGKYYESYKRSEAVDDIALGNYYENRAQNSVQRRAKSGDQLLGNWLHYSLYDTTLQRHTCELLGRVEIRRLCTFQLPPGPHATLQYVLDNTTHTSNEALSKQDDCPKDFNLHEYYVFATLRSGYRLQWRNIAREVTARILNFGHYDTYMLVAQAIWYAGPSRAIEILRDSHIDLEEEEFGASLMSSCEEVLETVEGSWQGATALRTLVILSSGTGQFSFRYCSWRLLWLSFIIFVIDRSVLPTPQSLHSSSLYNATCFPHVDMRHLDHMGFLLMILD